MVLDRERVRENIEKRVAEDILSGAIGGASVLVKQRGEVVYKNCFGNSGEGRELREDAIFRLASMTKPITAVAVMKQIERGLISLDDTLDKFIPEYAEMEVARVVDRKIESVTKAQGKIKILHLLSHSSGVGSGVLGELQSAEFTPEREHDLKSVTSEYASKPLAFEPYTAQAYSARVGFDLLARVVEMTSKMTFDKFLKKEIFEPLGMTDTTFVPGSAQWDRTVQMHRCADGKASFLPLDREHIFFELPLTYFCGGAGLVSTLSDYEKFADMLLLGGVGTNGARIIGEESVRLMRTPAIPSSFKWCKREIWGLGVRIVDQPDYLMPVGTYGWSGAFGTHFFIDPVNEIVGIYMKNSYSDGGSEARTARNFEKDVYL